MRFKFTGESENLGMDISFLDNEEIMRYLNRYKGWVFIKNEEDNSGYEDCIFYVDKYYIDRENIFMYISKKSNMVKKSQVDTEDIKINDLKKFIELTLYDIIYKLETVEGEVKPRTRWYRKGVLESYLFENDEFREPKYRNFSDNHELRHQLLELDEQKFNDMHHKYKWYVLTPNDRRAVKNNLFTLVNLAYDKIGGHIRINSPDRVVSDDSLNFWTAIDNNDNPYADIVIFGRKNKYGIKLSGFGHDMDRKSKSDLVDHLYKLLNIRGFFIEASGQVASRLIDKNTPVVHDINVIKHVLNAPEATYRDTDHVWYTRNIMGSKLTEVLFGKPIVKDISEGVKWYEKGKLKKDPREFDVDKYDDFITDDEFRNFLLKKGAYEAYIKNCKSYRNVNNKILSSKFKKEIKSSYISGFFSWSETPEGGDYWGNLNLEWRDLIKNRPF